MSRQVQCPFCESKFEENCEYVDIGVGLQQCTANFCENCYASEKGGYSDNPEMVVKNGWWKKKDAI